MKKRLIVAGLLLVGVVSSYGNVVQGWDVSNDSGATVPAGWTTWDNASAGVGGFSTVGGLTLTHTSGAFASWGNSSATPITFSAAALLAGDNGVFRDGGSIAATPVVFTLSGLTAGRTYQIQFTANVVANKNLGISQDGGTAQNILSPTPTVAAWVYSPVFTFNANAGDLDTAFTITRSVGAGTGGYISGVIVNTIPEPATTSMLGLAGIVILLVRRWATR